MSLRLRCIILRRHLPDSRLISAFPSATDMAIAEDVATGADTVTDTAITMTGIPAEALAMVPAMARGGEPDGVRVGTAITDGVTNPKNNLPLQLTL